MPNKRLNKLLEMLPLDKKQLSLAKSGASKISDEKAAEIAQDLDKSLSNLPKVVDALNKALAESSSHSNLENKSVSHKEHNSNQTSVLIIDTNTAVVDNLRVNLLEIDNTLNIIQCTSRKDALNKIKEVTLSLVLIDIAMPKMDGIAIYKTLKNSLEDLLIENIPIIAMADKTSADLRSKAMRAGIKVLPLDSASKCAGEILDGSRSSTMAQSMCEH